MAKAGTTPASGRAFPTVKKLQKLKIEKRTSIGSGTPLNKHKRRRWKKYRGQGRP